MHETGLALAMLEIAEREARTAGATRIVLLRVRVGAMSSVAPEAFAHAFAVLRAGTLAGDAELAFETAPARWWCPTCGQAFTSAESYPDCPQCCAPATLLPGANELQLISLEVE